MPNKIQVRRGLKAELPVLAVGEPGFCTDTKELYIGTPEGNVKVDASDIAAWAKAPAKPTYTKAEIDGLSDVDNTSDADKPVSSATKAALDGKAPMDHASTGDEYGPATNTMKGHVALSNGTSTTPDVKAVAYQYLASPASVDLNGYRTHGEWTIYNASEALNFPPGTWTGTANPSFLKVVRIYSNTIVQQTLHKRGSYETWIRYSTSSVVWGEWQMIPTPQAVATNVATRVLTLADAGKVLIASTTAARTITIPSNANVAFPIGTQVKFVRTSTGALTIEGETDVTIQSVDGKLTGFDQYAMLTMTKIATDTWNLSADVYAIPANHASTASTYGLATDASYGHVRFSNGTATTAGSRAVAHEYLASPTSIDLNGYRLHGEWTIYPSASTEPLNFPPGTWTGTANASFLKVVRFYSDTIVQQILHRRGSHEIWVRYSTSSTAWGEWVMLQTSATTSVSVTASRALALTDAGRVLEVSSTAARTITIPDDATVNFPIGTEIEITRENTGAVNIAAASGVTLQSLGGLRSISGQYGSVALRKRAANDWRLVGALA